MDVAAPPPLPPTHRDRRTGLLLFGIFEIIIGAFFALSLPLGILGQVALARQQGHEFDATFLGPMLLTSGGGAAGLIILGIGSIRGRRWARALLLILGWAGLITGVITLAMIVPALGGFEEMMQAQMRQQGGREMPAIAVTMAKVMMVLTTLIFYVVIPGALILFYRSPHVKRTCELMDPTERWTDRVPLPVIAVVLLAAFGASCVLLMPKFGGMMPFFGHTLTGWTARLVWLGVSAFSVYTARGLYRRDYLAWKLYLGFIVLAAANYAFSLSVLGLDGYYRASGLPEWQIQQIAANPMVRGFSGWSAVVGMVPFVGFVVYLRRYFVGGGQAAAVG
jgi:hypothetical protein